MSFCNGKKISVMGRSARPPFPRCLRGADLVCGSDYGTGTTTLQRETHVVEGKYSRERQSI